MRSIWARIRQNRPRYDWSSQLNGAKTDRPSGRDLLRSREALERLLTENILPFWYPQVLDEEEGGYRLNHDLQGRWKGRANKHLVTQSRMLWFFSRLVGTNHGTSEHLEAARHGYDFLREHMWDERFGGFYWEVSPSGSRAVRPNKHLYGQACAHYALVEYARTSGDPTARALTQEVFGLLEDRAHDRLHGGYREFFRRDWSPLPANTRGYLGGVTPDIKLDNTHLHLMEALTSHYLFTSDPLARDRLVELIIVNSNAIVRKRIGACTSKYQRDWTPLRGTAHDRVSYGHDVKKVWLLMEACAAAGLSNSPLLDLYRTLFWYALRYGFDQKKGGFYEAGPFNAPADRRDKIWWVQAEGLLAALYMYRDTREEPYFTCFSRTLDWILDHQADWKHGDWYAHVDKSGRPSGDKANEWKAAYHNGRAVIQSLEMLSDEP
jgi:cellobiose epimerase